jgi:pilus assembly protein Flp/PilA
MKRRLNGVLYTFVRLLRAEAGATAIEYTLIASIISLGIFVGAGLLGDQLKTTFTNVATEVQKATE